MNAFDEQMMHECLKLAQKGQPAAFPNPLVGAVIVKDKKIIAKGYHKQFGADHAEIDAIKNGGQKKYSGATLYCNLEPCAHHGKTPPCVDAVINADFKRVVIGTTDPNPKVAGKSIKKLEEAGIEVVINVLAEECQQLNRFFFRGIKSNHPYIHAKIAASLDGKIALNNSESKWITDKETRDFARKRRKNFQAILVGANTVIADNPYLGLDPERKKAMKDDPIRIILDPHGKTAVSSSVYRDKNYILCTKKESAQQGHKGKILEFTDYSIKKIIEKLYQECISSILVEGGAYTISKLLEENLVDSIDYYIAPILLGSGKSAIQLPEIQKISEGISFKKTQIQKIGKSLLIEAQILAF